ncbi:MAG: hypothetical protein PHN55_15810 [Dysgonamonadaceae bacterium]|nr:hypothetical protein [Dysgonamonadaceae bacterium]
MNKKNAIKVLENQKSKLIDNKIYKDETWVFQTASFIKDFFGEDSTEYSFISQFNFYVKVPNGTSPEETRFLLDNKKNKAEKFIDDCIETIKTKGLIKRTKINFLNRLTNGAIVSIMTPIALAIFGAGFYFGTEKINNDNIELKSENKEITNKFDSLNYVITNLSHEIDSLLQSADSIENELIDAKIQIESYQNNHQTITVKYSEPYSLFGGLVLINAEKYYDEVKISFEGDIVASMEPDMNYKQKVISIKQGKRFYIKDFTNQDWIVNILKIDSFETKLELIKKTMP